MKSDNKKSLQNLENNSADLNQIKGGKKFSLKNDTPNKEPNSRNTESPYAGLDSKYLTNNSRSEMASDNYTQAGSKDPHSTS